MAKNNYQICKRCIMDTTDSEITFDENGVCNHCRQYEKRAKEELQLDEAGQKQLQKLVNKIKEDGKNKEYDCIIGVSGGVDSTFVAYKTKELGLRPLAVHLDNGWDAELAVGNTKNMLNKLGIDLYTHVIDWEEFKDLQLAFLRSSTANAEIPTDHAIVALLYHTAVRRKIRYILSGGNIVTEAVMPSSWGYDARDWKYIRAIHKKFGRLNLKTFSHLTLFNWIDYTFFRRIKFIPILNYFPYVKKKAKELIAKELGWRDYGTKHFESIYTRFFQAYILPTKFGFDKRKAHLSNLICSGQITREEALEEMEQDPYPNQEILRQDKEYVLKKLGLTEEEFEQIMSQPIKTFKDYPNDYFWFNESNFFTRLAKKRATRNY